MDQKQINRYGDALNKEFIESDDRLDVVSKALKDYVANGKTIKQFEEEYGCELLYGEHNVGINGVKFQNDSNKTMFMLKYDNDTR